MLSTYRCVGALLAGLVASFGLAWPIAFGVEYGSPTWWLHFLAVVCLVRLLAAVAGPFQAGFVGFLFQFAALCVNLGWLETSMSDFGGLPPALAWMAVGVLSALLALYTAAAAATWKVLQVRAPELGAPLFAALWLLSELACGQWLTGFGWSAAGYAHLDGPFAWTAPWVGSYGLAAFAAFTAALIAQPERRRHRTAATAIVVILGIGAWLSPRIEWTESTQQLDVSLLQGNIAQDQKFDARTGVAEALRWYGEQLRTGDADLILAPETAIPLLPDQLPTTFWSGWTRQMENHRGDMRMVGIPMGDPGAGYTNSVVAFENPTQTPWYRYDKHHLVPFGEFIPPLFKWFVRMMNIPLGDFERGALAQPALTVHEERIAPAICFEDLFSEELGARFRDKEASPTILTNFSNLAWFGNSTAMYQHLNISRMRSLEFARPSLRVSNTRVMAVVDHDGEVKAALPTQTQGVLHAKVRGRTGQTPYAWWVSRWGQLPLWGLALGFLVFVIKRIRGSQS